MSVKVGDVCYIWCHAYLRLIGRVTEVLGSRRVALENASKVLDDDEGDEAFFRRGVHPEKTLIAHVGSVKDVAYLGAIDFPFPLPLPQSEQKSRR